MRGIGGSNIWEIKSFQNLMNSKRSCIAFTWKKLFFFFCRITLLSYECISYTHIWVFCNIVSKELTLGRVILALLFLWVHLIHEYPVFWNIVSTELTLGRVSIVFLLLWLGIGVVWLKPLDNSPCHGQTWWETRNAWGRHAWLEKQVLDHHWWALGKFALCCTPESSH